MLLCVSQKYICFLWFFFACTCSSTPYSLSLTKPISSAFQLLYEQGISLRTSFLVLSFCSIIHLLRTFLLMPRTHIPYPLPQYYTYGWEHQLVFEAVLHIDHLHRWDMTFIFLMDRPSCGQGNTYNVEQFERIREGAMAASQESSGRDSIPLAPEDGTEAQDSGKGTYPHCCLHIHIVRCG